MSFRKKYNPDEISIETRNYGPRIQYVVLVGGFPRLYCRTMEAAQLKLKEIERELHEHKKREHDRLTKRKV